ARPGTAYRDGTRERESDPEDRYRGIASGLPEQQWQEHYGGAHRPHGARYLDGEHAPHLPGHVVDVHRGGRRCGRHRGARSLACGHDRATAPGAPGRRHGGRRQSLPARLRLGGGERHHPAHGAPHHGGRYPGATACHGRQTLVRDGGDMNLTQKLIKSHLVSGNMTPGEEIALPIDQTLSQDATGTLSYLQFEAIGVPRVRTQLSVSYVDHNMLQGDFRNADDHVYLQDVAAKYGLYYSRPGNGICHQVHLERFAVPGTTLLGTDSH